MNSLHATLLSALLALAPTVGCSDALESEAPAAENVQTVEQSIVSGDLATTEHAVVALIGNGHVYCSGTLIAPEVVLTAAHCLPPNLSDLGVHRYEQISVFFGNNVMNGDGEKRDVVDGWTHPSWTQKTLGNDVGLLRLESAGPVWPMAYSTTAMTAADVGASVKVVGFGITDNNGGGAGQKRKATTTVDEVLGFGFYMPITPSGTCNGDSGGTAMMVKGGAEMVVGIHSRSDCETTSFDTRVDSHVEVLSAFIEGNSTAPQCWRDSQCASGCGTIDPDCPCADDNFCSDQCSAQGDDPDCTVCDDAGTCTQGCESDNVCNEACLEDPDCLGCGADNQCNESCTRDPDCWVAGGLSLGEEESSAASCTLGAGPSAPSAPSWAPVMLLTALGWLRRRKNNRRAQPKGR